MKRVLCLILVVTVLLTGSMFSLVSAQDTRVSQDDAEKAAASFILSDIVNNTTSQWDASCKIGEVTPVYDFSDNITGYSMQVVKEGVEKGYIVISSNINIFPVIEYSYKSKSPSEFLQIEANKVGQILDKIYTTNGINYFAKIKGNTLKDSFKSLTNEYFKKSDLILTNDKLKFDVKSVENNELWQSIKSVDRNAINELFVKGTKPDNSDGGVISNPETYLKNKLGQNLTFTYVPSQSKLLEYVGNWLMEDYESVNGVGKPGAQVNNCTLSSLSNIMIYYAANGYKKIQLDRAKIYAVVHPEAVKFGYTPSGGLTVTKNNNLVDAVWSSFGYTDGSGSNDYMWSKDSLISEINANKPFMMSYASGQYYNHTVTARGYVTYKNGNKAYQFLAVRDNWNSGDRYLSDLESRVACMTRVNPPSSK